jgi:transposase-like protein
LRHLPLVDLLVDTKTELFELALRSGLKAFTQMLEEDRTAICGPRYVHEPARPASRAGYARGEVILGGRKVIVRRPRARTADREVPLPTFQTMAQQDPLDRRVVEQMLVGVATRQYARSLEPLDAAIETRATSKSAVSRRFIARTRQQLETWRSRPLDDLALAVLLVDGVHVGDHCLIVALGVSDDGTKHALGVWEGSTEHSATCKDLLANLQSRGLRTDRSVLVILDGSKALHKAVRSVFSAAALIQRCQATRSATCSTICRTGSGHGSRPSCFEPAPATTSARRNGNCKSSLGNSRPITRAPPRASAKDSTRRSP